MDEKRCWEIIEAARADAGTDWDHLDGRLAAALIDRLVELPPEQVVRFDDYFRALQRRVDRADLFMAAFLIHHGCGDAFGDFRAGLVGLGRDWYSRVLADPDVLADHPAVRGVAAGTVNTSVLLTEGFHFAPRRALHDLTGEEDDGYFFGTGTPVRLPQPAGPALLPRRLERLAALFPRQQQDLRASFPHLTS